MRELLEYLCRGGYVLFLADTEHIITLSGKVTVGKARAGKYASENVSVTVCITVFNCFFAGGNRRRNVFGTLHSALNFKAENARFIKFVYMLNQA